MIIFTTVTASSFAMAKFSSVSKIYAIIIQERKTNARRDFENDILNWKSGNFENKNFNSITRVGVVV